MRAAETSIQTSAPLAGERYIASLNGVRGLAIAMVLAVHLAVDNALPITGAFWHRFNQLMWMGWSGVDLFFVLSGFLITGILIDTRNASNFFRSFYGRRALRIFPLYYLLVVFAIVFGVTVLPRLRHYLFFAPFHTTIAGWVSYLLYFQNWWIPLRNPTGGFPLGHFWSLGVEEEFYLVWPMCVFLLRDKALVRVCVGVSIGVLALRCLLVQHLGGTAFIILTSTATRADALLMGALVALVVRDAAMLRLARRIAPFAGGIACAVVLAITLFAHEIQVRSTWTQSIGLTAYAVAYAVVVLYVFLADATGTWLDRAMRWRWLQFAGKYSYGIYVYHAIVFLAVTLLVRQKRWYGVSAVRGLLLDAFVVAVSVGIAYASFQLYESRFLRMKHRFAARVEAHLPPPGVGNRAS